jgi:hypothetical protein
MTPTTNNFNAGIDIGESCMISVVGTSTVRTCLTGVADTDQKKTKIDSNFTSVVDTACISY